MSNHFLPFLGANHINAFKDQLIRFTFSVMEQTMLSNSNNHSNNSAPFVNSIEENSVPSPFQPVVVNPYAYHQQVGFQQEGFTMPSTNMNFPFQQQPMTNYYPPNFPTHLSGYGTFNKS